jgi:hypothetical protein
MLLVPASLKVNVYTKNLGLLLNADLNSTDLGRILGCILMAHGEENTIGSSEREGAVIKNVPVPFMKSFLFKSK